MNSLLQRHRKPLGAIALVMAVGLILGFVPWRATDSWRAAATQRLSVSLGAPELTAGDVRFTLLPVPRLTLSTVAFAQNSGGISLRAEEAVVHLSALDLLAGRAKPAGLTLFGADVGIRLQGQREKGFRDAIDIITQVAGSVLIGQVSAPLPWLDIDGGRIVVSRGDDPATMVFEDAEVRLRLPSLRQPVAFSFRGRQDGALLKASFSGATPAVVLSRGREPITFAYSGQGIDVAFDGDGLVSASPALTGQLVVTSTGAALTAFGFPLTEQPDARVSLKSTLDYSSRGANLADIKLGIGSDQYDGVGSVRHDGQRWHISGTLASERANLSALLAPFRTLRRNDGRWNDAPFEIDALFANSIDLRLSADRLVVFDKTLEKVALSVLTRPNKAEVTLGEGTWNKGALKLRLAAVPGSFGLDVKINGSVEKADFGAIITEFAREKRLTGQGNGNLTLETSGRNIAQFVANAEGKVAAVLRGGELLGIDLNRLASRRGTRPDLALTESLGGRTPFETATFSAKISNGTAQPVDGHMRAGRLVGTLQGSIDFGRAAHDLTGLVVQTPADAQAAEPIPVLDFTISGPLLEPRITPNIAALLRRS